MSVRRARMCAAGVAGALLLTSFSTLGSVAGTTLASSAQAAPGHHHHHEPWSPAPGITFNNPLLPKRSHVINKKIRMAINHSRKGETIRLITWNLKSALYTHSIVDAHRRGVGVRVIMSAGLAHGQSSHGSYATIRRGLSKGNKGRPARLKSWIRICHDSCRGRHGIVHSKFFLFSKVGKAEDIVMSGSGNLTEVAANRQWDDLTTIVNRPKTYRNFMMIFNQASRDRPVKHAYHHFTDGSLEGWFYPRMGQKDTILKLLAPVHCHGAIGAAANHTTVIRIAQAVFNGQRGLRIARRIRQLHSQGCNIRIDYTAMANSSQRVLAPVPKRHIVQDFDGDGLYDRYLHMKAIAINGNYGNDHSHKVVLNGSANWSGMSLKSDEQGLILHQPKAVGQYIAWINHIFEHPPPKPKPVVVPPIQPTPPTQPTQPTQDGRSATVNPYAHVELD
jgi:phosphatidylserine/phosphatidylglycerophosphate/cardiolipin synthase-like enzyme